MLLPISPPIGAASALELVLVGAAAALAVVLLMMWLRERHVGRARAARRSDEVDRELGAVAQLSASLADTRDADQAARLLVDAVFTSIGVDFAAVALVDEQARRARGLVARGRPEVEEWWPSMRVHLDSEPSAIAETIRARTPLPVDDVESSPIVNPRLAAQVRAKSAAFVPVLAEGEVEAVLVVAREQARPVAAEELALLAALAAETALALERVRSATALEDALARERLVAGIGRRVRSELDLDAVLRVAVEELGRAIGVSRAFIRLGETGEAMPVLAEWDAPGAPPVGDEAPRLPALNLALRERRTVRIADIETAKEIHDPALGDVGCCAGWAREPFSRPPSSSSTRASACSGSTAPGPATGRTRMWRLSRRSRVRPASRSTLPACSRPTAAASSSRQGSSKPLRS